MSKIAFVFSGQGAQAPGMGKELYDCSPAAKAVFDLADSIRPGTSQQCFEGTQEELNVTINTQPCLFACDLAAAKAAQERGIQPDCAAGFSLGEAAAVAFSGMLTEAEAFSMVCKRAELMNEAAQKNPGAMAAVMKLSPQQVETLCGPIENAWPVNYNSPKQTVVAASADTIDQVVEAAIRGAERGMKEYPRIRVGLILCCMRGDTNQELNMQTVETAKKYLGSVVCAVDIAGAEGLFPTEMFVPVFAKVREYGLPMTIHAGEAAGPDSMRTALSYGTKRIGHGVAAIEDPELVKRLVEEGITLEVSVTSNYHTKVVDRLEDHPIRRLFDAGVRVTINSDNMTCSRTNVNKELDLMRTVFGFTEEEIEKMEEYAWEARFLKN